jgi:hypothetical protein
MKMAVFWVAALCSLVEFYRRFKGVCCFRHQGVRPDTYETSVNFISLQSAKAKKTAIFRHYLDNQFFQQAV